MAAGTKRAPIDVEWAREQFMSLGLEQDGERVVYLDNPAGTQVPRRTMESIARYFATANANVHGAFLTSRRTDDLVAAARDSVAAFLGAASAREIAFGPNMTTLTYAVSRALGREWGQGDEVVVTDLDHDGNVTPWMDLIERGVTIRRVPIRLEDCTLDMEALGAILSSRTRLVAVTHASNAVGTVVDVAAVARMAHAVGALVWVDAVHYGPHGPIDVGALDVDFLVCSAYKFFGPHLGIFWGREELLEEIQAYHLRAAPDTVPDRFETGTKSHELLAGLLGTLDYLVELGTMSGAYAANERLTLAGALHRTMAAVKEYERGLSAALLEGLQSVPGLTLYGIADKARLDERVPTFAFNVGEMPAGEVSRLLGERGVFTWHGNYYALDLMERLGLNEHGGAVRVGAVHYNTPEEIERLVATLREVVW
jgi:cysteine desulfurase family protein (TIGR01976 family)